LSLVVVRTTARKSINWTMHLNEKELTYLDYNTCLVLETSNLQRSDGEENKGSNQISNYNQIK